MGFAAAMTSSFAMTAKVFPNNVATVLVSADKSYASIHVLWTSRESQENKNCIIVTIVHLSHLLAVAWKTYIVYVATCCNTNWAKCSIIYSALFMLCICQRNHLFSHLPSLGQFGDFHRTWSYFGATGWRVVLPDIWIWSPFYASWVPPIDYGSFQHICLASHWWFGDFIIFFSFYSYITVT